MSRSIIDYYRDIEAISRKMLIAAQKNTWDELCEHENHCRILIGELREFSKDKELSQPQRKEKTRIMQSILRNDAAIRIIVEPWLAKVEFRKDAAMHSSCLN